MGSACATGRHGGLPTSPVELLSSRSDFIHQFLSYFTYDSKTINEFNYCFPNFLNTISPLSYQPRVTPLSYSPYQWPPSSQPRRVLAHRGLRRGPALGGFPLRRCRGVGGAELHGESAAEPRRPGAQGDAEGTGATSLRKGVAGWPFGRSSDV